MAHQVVLCKILLKSRNLNERTTFEDGISVIFLKNCEKKSCKFRKIAVGLEARNRELSIYVSNKLAQSLNSLWKTHLRHAYAEQKQKLGAVRAGRPQQRCVLMIKDRFNQNLRRFQIRVSPTDRN